MFYKETKAERRLKMQRMVIASAAIFYLKIGPLSWSFPIKVVFLHTTNLS